MSCCLKERLETEPKRIELGRLGEYGARKVKFKLDEFSGFTPSGTSNPPELDPTDPEYDYNLHIYYPNSSQIWNGCSMVLIHQRSKDFAPYVVADYYVSGNELIWNVGADDTACEGIGYAEIHMASNGVLLAKSVQYLTYTEEALGAASDPAPYSDITIETITALVATALGYKNDAATSAANAAASAAAAAASAATIVNTPYVGDNGNWYIWQNGQYVDSGISAAGPNLVSSSTATTLTGVLKGDSGYITTATVDSVPDTSHTGNLISSSAVAEALAKMIIKVDFGTLTGTGDTVIATKSNANITANHEVFAYVLGTPSANTGGIDVTISDGEITVSGVINGSTTLTLILGWPGAYVS